MTPENVGLSTAVNSQTALWQVNDAELPKCMCCTGSCRAFASPCKNAGPKRKITACKRIRWSDFRLDYFHKDASKNLKNCEEVYCKRTKESIKHDAFKESWRRMEEKQWRSWHSVCEECLYAISKSGKGLWEREFHVTTGAERAYIRGNFLKCDYSLLK